MEEIRERKEKKEKRRKEKKAIKLRRKETPPKENNPTTRS